MEEKEYFGYVYKFTNTLNGKIYIGKREKKKFDQNYYGSGKFWAQAVNKVGKDNIERQVLCWCYSREELIEKEIFYIKEFNSTNKDIGYNIHRGGYGGNSLGDTAAWSALHSGKNNGRYGKPVSEETRKKIGNANRGRKYSDEINKKKGRPGVKKPAGFAEKCNKIQKGKIVSEETKKKISDALKGRNHPMSEEIKQKISTALIGKRDLSGKNNGMYGKKHTEESKRKMSLSKKGKTTTSKKFSVWKQKNNITQLKKLK